jgi:drug/metabolite transporter (DMT)-like permease
MLPADPIALALSTACGLALAGADYFRKAVPRSVPTAAVLFYFLAIQIPLLGLWLAVDRPAAPNLGTAYWIPALCDVAASLVGNALFIVAVRRSPLIMVVPLLALIPVIAIALGAALLGERPTPVQGAGIALAAAGVFLLYLPAERFSPAAVWRNFRAEPGALPMLAVAASWALTAPLDKLAVAAAGVPVHGIIQVSLLWLLTGTWIAFRPGTSLALPPVARLPIVAAGLCAGVSYGLQLAAYNLTLVSVVESLKRVAEIGTTVLIGALIFRERVTAARALGLALIACGVPLMLVPAGE